MNNMLAKQSTGTKILCSQEPSHMIKVLLCTRLTHCAIYCPLSTWSHSQPVPPLPLKLLDTHTVTNSIL